MRHLLILLLAFTGSCDILSPNDSSLRQDALKEVSRRESLWKASAIQHYDFDFVRDCDCAAAAEQPVLIHVRNDVVARVVDAQGTDVAPGADVSWPTADSLFAWSRQLLGSKDYSVEITFDTTFNFPSLIRADNGRSLIMHAASNFIVRTATAPIVASYRIAVPFSKSKSVSRRSR